MFLLFPFPSFVCVCTFFFSSSCDYFSPLYVVYRMCISIEKQTTNNTNRALPYYLCTDFLFLSISAAIELYLLLKHPTNVHCDWCVSNSFLSLSSAFFLLLSDDVLCL